MSAGIISLAIHYPRRWMPNEYWRIYYPDMVKNAEDSILNRFWKPEQDSQKTLFEQATEPYVSDPFRGVKDRRWLEPGQTALSIEIEAARAALDAAKLTTADIDLCIVGSVLTDSFEAGNAPRLAQALDLPAAAWNLETACSSALVGFKTAAGLVDSGQHDRVLVVNSCSYSRVMPETEPISWANGDGASAFIVGRVTDGKGYLGGYCQHTGSTCGAFKIMFEVVDGEAQVHLRPHKNAGKMIRTVAEPMLRTCVHKALETSKVSINDIDFFIFNTPMAWFVDFCINVLEINKRRTINMHSAYANTGPVLTPTNLFHAVHQELIHENDLVLLFSIGSVSSSAAVVVRWTDIAVGPLPPEVSSHVQSGGLI